MPEATNPTEGAPSHRAKPDQPEGLLAAPPQQHLLKPLDVVTFKNVSKTFGSGPGATAEGLGDVLEGHHIQWLEQVLLGRRREQALGLVGLRAMRRGSFGGVSGFGHKSLGGFAVRKEQFAPQSP